eukprot:TRINITY_DN3861_c0_g2_i1.p1 TRINITY_DN3861_c0_g2~~TRINITY_DN3861_c0_g2_i1.p1  ORF type:complete len:163 (+),score=10.24 TRINITY_DN3861_c0_g2_i1:227-715(+)
MFLHCFHKCGPPEVPHNLHVKVIKHHPPPQSSQHHSPSSKNFNFQHPSLHKSKLLTCLILPAWRQEVPALCSTYLHFQFGVPFQPFLHELVLDYSFPQSPCLLGPHPTFLFQPFMSGVGNFIADSHHAAPQTLLLSSGSLLEPRGLFFLTNSKHRSIEASMS